MSNHWAVKRSRQTNKENKRAYACITHGLPQHPVKDTMPNNRTRDVITFHCPYFMSVIFACPYLMSVISACPYLMSVIFACPYLMSVISACPCLMSVISACPYLMSVISACPVRGHSHMSVPLPGTVYHTVSAILAFRHDLDRL